MEREGNYTFSLAVVICYIGKLPWYFRYFAHSCSYNKSVDFIIIGDDTSWRYPLPDNIKVIEMNLEQINLLASAKTQVQTQIKNGYKLCDLKPAYGDIFSDLLKGYDFWGHGDLDVIFGNIRAFITDDILACHDVVCVRHDYTTGYFQLFRNIEKMNQLYRRSKDFKFVFQNDRHFCFDETNFTFDQFAASKPYNSIPSEVESMMHVIRAAEREGLIRPFFDFMVVEGIPGNLKWERGNLFYRTNFEILLYHMIHFKRKCIQKKPPENIGDVFYISKNRIYQKKRKGL